MIRSSALRLGGLVVIGTTAAAAVAFLPIERYLVALLEWVRGVGLWGAVVLGAAYVPASVLFVPGAILTLGAGFLFGVLLGTVVVSIGSTLGATAAFLVGRTFAREWVASKVKANPRFGAIDRAVGRQGFKIVFLTRLSPVFPFNLLNYAYGITDVRLRDYFLASWIGMLPGTVMYVYLGSAAQNLAALVAGRVEGGMARQVLFAVGLLATIAVTVYVTRLARRALREAASLPEGEVAPPTDEEEVHA